MDNATATAENIHPINEAPPIAPPMALVRRSPLELIHEATVYLEDLDRVANALCKATILPKAMQNASNLKLVLWQGVEMGFTVMQSIRASFIIEKEGEPPKVGYYADSLVALVRTSPVCRFFRVEIADHTKNRIVCARKDEPEEVIHVYDLTIEAAQKANLDKKWFRGRGGEWQSEVKYQWMAWPDSMLNARNSSRSVRRTFQDVAFGMHTPEELDDLVIAAREETRDGFYAVPLTPPRPAAASSPPPSGSAAAASPATSKKEPEIVDAVLVPDEEAPPPAAEPAAESGDPAWDSLLHELAQLTGDRELLQAFPPEVTLRWDAALLEAKTRKEVNALAPWIGAANKRASQSKACAELGAHMQKSFNERTAQLRKEEHAAAAAKKGGQS